MASLHPPLLSDHDIRVVVVTPAHWEDDLEVSLTTVSLADNPHYKTLSYVWGDPTDVTNIRVNGFLVPARRNLVKALRQIRSEIHTPLEFWIDALCINQQDMAERSRQVALMGRIYRSSQEGFLWLGEVEDEPLQPMQLPIKPSARELEILRDCCKDIRIDRLENLQGSGSKASIDVQNALKVVEILASGKHLFEMPFYRVQEDGTVELCPTWSKAVYTLENILRRGWWRRVWTFQEAYLPERAQIRIGPHKAPFTSFLSAIRAWKSHTWRSPTLCCSSIDTLWIGYQSELLDRILHDLDPLILVRDAKKDPTIAVIPNIFLISIRRHATLLHDRAYGILGVAEEFYQLKIVPDYTAPLWQVYATITMDFTRNAKHLCLLPYARPFQQRTPNLPSWVPDWGIDSWDDSFDLHTRGGFKSDGGFAFSYTNSSDNILELEGIIVDRVVAVGQRMQTNSQTAAEDVATIESWLAMASSQGLSSYALWELFHVATHVHVGLQITEVQAEWWDIVKEMGKRGASKDEVLLAARGTPYIGCHNSMQFLTNRAVFSTKPARTGADGARDQSRASQYRSHLAQGSMGLSLPFVEAGDLIILAKGAHVPLIVRPVPADQLNFTSASERQSPTDSGNYFHFVGLCYLYGAMQGQAISEGQDWTTYRLC